MNNKTFGERIAELRRKRSMTQENLAEIIGVSAQAVSKWENSATMPDILLLPLLADTLCVSIDELFGLPCKTREEPFPIEDTPAAVYDKILTTMCRWDSSVTDDAQFLANAKAGFAKKPQAHTGFISQTAGAVYADRDIALSYLPNTADSVKLLEEEKIGTFLQVLSEENVRRVLAYQCRNPEQTFTAASVSAPFSKYVALSATGAPYASIEAGGTVSNATNGSCASLTVMRNTVLTSGFCARETRISVAPAAAAMRFPSRSTVTMSRLQLSNR